jgi:transcriptional regulator GlxA family with amidase domain
MDVAIVLYDGFDELDAIGPYEVFANAVAAAGEGSVALVTLGARETVTASHGLRVEPDGSLAAADPAPDLLVVPGGGWNDRAPESAWAEAERGDLPDAIAAHHDRGGALAAVCTGGMLLARAGVLDGRPAVTHRGAMDDLRATDAEVIDRRVVDDGDVVTAGGVTSGLDMAVHVVDREFGADVAEAVVREMAYEPSDDVYVSGASGAPGA